MGPFTKQAESARAETESGRLASPQIDLDTHIEDVVNVLRYEDLTGVLLVGWSYGGMVVAGVADRAPERVAHSVFSTRTCRRTATQASH